jgi:hypothetical protein
VGQPDGRVYLLEDEDLIGMKEAFLILPGCRELPEVTGSRQPELGTLLGEKGDLVPA